MTTVVQVSRIVATLSCIYALFFHVSGPEAATLSDLQTLENRITGWCMQRIRQEEAGLSKNLVSPPPTTADLWSVAQNWHQLTPGFKKIYQAALLIPESFSMHRSSGFNIEIYYTTEGNSAVDTTDTLGINQNEWYQFSDESNGIPDYIDQVAFAIDSAWSMEVESFGFPAPQPYTVSEYPSANYKVLIESNTSGYYGLTFPIGSDTTSDIGFASIVTLRNSWKGWDINSIIDYETHPEKAIRITCTHEFFHAIQYRMAHMVHDEIFIDNLPLTFIEGTAVMMEELAFPDVNDFSQYAVDYFENPGNFAVFGNVNDATVYSNVLFCLYLYDNNTPDSHGIDYFRSVFASNMNEPALFEELIKNASKEAGRTWSDLLNAFHTASFYSGNRTCDGRFLEDAALLPQWQYTKGEGNATNTVTKRIKPSCMNYFSYINSIPADSTLLISCATTALSDSGTFSVRVVLHDSIDSEKDTIMSFESILPDDTVNVSIGNWSAFNEAIVIASNGLRDHDITCTVDFNSNHPTVMTQRSDHITTPPCQLHKAPMVFRLDGRVASRAANTRYSKGLYIKRTAPQMKPRLFIH
jgi:hypothetical protein